MPTFKSYPVKSSVLMKLLQSKEFKLSKKHRLGNLQTVEGSKLNYFVLADAPGTELYYLATVLPKRLEVRFMIGGGARNDHFHLTGHKKQANELAVYKTLKEDIVTTLKYTDNIKFRQNTAEHYLSTFDLELFVSFYKATRLKPVTNQEVQDYLLEVYNESNDAYHQGTGESKLSDKVFDELKAYLTLLKLVDKESVGAAPTANKKKIDLKTPLGSLENAFDAADLSKFFKNFSNVKYIHTPKIDGISAQVDYAKGILKGGSTKGDGYVGEDITNLLKVMPAVPKKLNKPVTLSIRSELFMNNSLFVKKYGKSSGREKPFATARNMVAGQKNRNSPDPLIAKDISILGYEIINKLQNKDEQLSELEGLGFPTVPYIVTTLSKAEGIYKKFKGEDYLQDGSVIEVNNKEHRSGFIGSGINPNFAVAFKPETEEVNTTVRSIRWTISKDGYFKPTIFFDPITVGGVNVVKASVHNAKKVKENGLGSGAEIVIVRSGDAIPHLKRVIKPAKPQWPKGTNWTWNASGVDIVLKTGETSQDQEIEKIIIFFSALKVERFSDGLIKHFYTNGFKTIPDILHMTRKQILEEVPRQGETSSQNIINEFAKLKNPGVALPDLLYGSGCFGRGLGQGKFKDLYAQYGDDLVTGWTGSTLADIAASIDEIPGFSYETGKQFAQGIKPFISFYKSVKDVIYVKKRNTTSGKWSGQFIAFSGFRNKDWVKAIEDLGGTYSDSVSSKTTLLVSDTTSEKTKKAEKNGTKIMTRKEFEKRLKGL